MYIACVIFLIFTIKCNYSNNDKNGEPTKTQCRGYNEDTYTS